MRRMNTRDNHTTADVDGARTFIRTSTLTNKPDSYGVQVRRSGRGGAPLRVAVWADPTEAAKHWLELTA